MRTRVVPILFSILITAAVANGQSRWQPIAQPTTHNLNKVSFVDSLRGWVAGDHGTILRTTNGGTTWTTLNPGVPDNIRDIFMLNERLGWAVSWIEFTDTATYFGSEILKTTNGGTTWSASRFSQSAHYVFSIMFFDSLTGWIGGDRGEIEKTNDGGATWARAVTDSTVASGFTIRNIKFFSRQYGFAMGGVFDITGTVLRTTDGGEFWTGTSISPEPVFDMHYVDSLNVIGISGDYEYGVGLVETSSGGNRWDWRTLEIFGVPRCLAFRTKREGWAPAGNQIIVTRDTGRTWQITDTLALRQIQHLVFTDSLTGYAVADSGVIYKYRNTVVGVAEKNTSRPARSQLMQNYPNPFNPATTIRFTISPAPRNKHVSLSVIDILGRVVEVLVNEEKSAGEHSVAWDARDSPSGVYFYKLRVGSFVDVKKMLLVR